MTPDTNPMGRGEARPPADDAWPRGDALDALLAHDEVEAPDGLAERITASARRGAESGGAAPGGRRWPLRLVAPVAGLAAAAALALIVSRPGGEPAPADTQVEAPSDDLLAALPELEAYAFLAAELEPLEEDALFLLDPADELVLEVLDEE